MTLRATRNILITGASSGIGRALAEEYAAPKVFLALGGRNEKRLEETAEACRAKGAMVNARAVDVADRAAMEDWIAEMDECHPLELAVANAGISARSGDDKTVEERTRDVFVVNLAGVFNTVLPLIQPMKDRGRGQIALMSSLAGFRGLPNAPSYSASKVAVRAWGEAMRPRLAPHGIAVSVIYPGFVRTRMTATNSFPMPFLMDADEAAGIIRKGLAKGRARIGFPWPLYAAARLTGALPNWLFDPLCARLPRKE